MSFNSDFNGAIGIDLGTTYSCVAAMVNGNVDIIANEQGSRTTPSYVAFSNEGDRLIGEPAKNQAAMNPVNTIFDAKRLIGRRFEDESVQKDVSLFPFEVVNVDGAPHIKVPCLKENNLFAPQMISSMVLSKMRQIAEMKLGENVKKAVITVPAYFNDAQRQATKDAGGLAGLEVLRIINEPTAAAIAYGLDKRQKEAENKKEKTILIFDLGGGTFDVSLLTISGGLFKVKATAGDTHLGGEDFDNILVNHFIQDFKKRHNADSKLSSDARAMRRLRTACERAKRTLSTMKVAKIEIDALFEGIDYSANLTRAKFEDLCSNVFASTITPVANVLRDANIKTEQVEDIVLVGGSTRIPKIQALIAKFFNIGVEKLNRSINPDEAVAYGAAVQAAILTGTAGVSNQDILLMDVLPLSLGVELEGGIMGVVVPRNTPIPTIGKRVFTTAADNQTAVTFPIYEGERAMSKDNNLLGEFELSGLKPAPRGTPELETVFEIDPNGILKVTATDLASKLTANVTISNKPGRLTNDDVKKIIADAERNKLSDAEFTARHEAKQQLEEFIYLTEAKIREGGLAARLNLGDNAMEELSKALEWLQIGAKTATKDEIEKRRISLEKAIRRGYNSASGNNSNQRRSGKGRRG